MNKTIEVPQVVEFDPKNYHGLHYTEAGFDEEVENRVNRAKEEDEDFEEEDISNYRYNFAQNVYKEWNNASFDQIMQWQTANTMKYFGYAASGFTEASDDNPLLEPIHGISLKDYVGIVLKSSGGIDIDTVLNAVGIDSVIYGEVAALWAKRMQEDTSFTVTTLYGQYFSEPVTHPGLAALGVQMSEQDKAMLQKLETDRYFYEELCGARQAAYEYGLDGAQWIKDNFGIGLSDFSAVGVKYMTASNLNINMEKILHYQDYQESKHKEYAEKFAAQQGGNVSDDITF